MAMGTAPRHWGKRPRIMDGRRRVAGAGGTPGGTETTCPAAMPPRRSVTAAMCVPTIRVDMSRSPELGSEFRVLRAKACVLQLYTQNEHPGTVPASRLHLLVIIAPPRARATTMLATLSVAWDCS